MFVADCKQSVASAQSLLPLHSTLDINVIFYVNDWCSVYCGSGMVYGYLQEIELFLIEFC